MLLEANSSYGGIVIIQTLRFTKIVLEEWKNETNHDIQAAYGRAVVLEAGKSVILYALHRDDAEGHGNTPAVTSLRGQKILISRAVRMGELGTVQELAEGERYHCANTCLFREVRYSEPVCLGPRRRINQIVAIGPRFAAVQFGIYTDLGDGIAQEDRIFGVACPDETTQVLNGLLPVARFLASEKTLV